MNPLPPTLDRFGDELEEAVGRDLRSRRRRRYALRGAALVAAAAAVALGVLSALPTGGPSVVQRAVAALDSPGETILHYRMDAEQRNPDESIVTWHSETWQLLGAPYSRRQIAVDSNGRTESASSGDLNELYDAGNDTIYRATSQELFAARMPRITIVSRSKLARLTGSASADVAYVVGKGGKRPAVVATRRGARRLRQQLAHEQRDATGALPGDFRAEILALLRSGRVRVTRHVEVGGRDAIRLESLDGKRIYLVDAASYDPIEWTTSGNGGSVTLRFPVYEQLPVDGESLQLLDLEAQHPAARVVRDPAAYIAAEARLFPHG
jgi:hypothetical protein